jgi:hypothetical protein
MAEDDQRCGNCHWWRMERVPHEREDEADSSDGRCLAAPPTADASHDDRGRWPSTFSNEWCGQWRERDSEPRP